MATAWTKQQVEALLASGDFAYQDIALPYGLSTGGYDRSATARAIFPDDMRGKSVLDLGSKFGYFCFEAVKRGATRVLGVDVDPDSVAKARQLADCLGLDVEFALVDIEETPIRESFDYVLCLNLLHHMKHPIKLLDDLIAITREQLVLELAALGRRDRRKLGVSPLAGLFLRREAVMYVSKNGTSRKRSAQKFFVTPGAIENLLRYQRHMFARVETLPSEHKGRFLAKALKRRIGHLVIVTGPTSSGKKTLLRKLVGNQIPEVARRAGIEDGAQWGPYQHANKLWQPSEPVRERLLLHYDFLRPHLRSAKVHKRDEALDILRTAQRITFLTIWTPPERLVRQISEGEIARRTKLGIYFGRERHRKIREEYRDPARVLAHYRAWFDYTRGIPADHHVVCLEDPVRVLSVAEWEQRARALEGERKPPAVRAQ